MTTPQRVVWVGGIIAAVVTAAGIAYAVLRAQSGSSEPVPTDLLTGQVSPEQSVSARPSPVGSCTESSPCLDPEVTSTPGLSATVTITSASWDEELQAVWVGATVEGTDPEGTCVLVLHQGDRSVEVQTPAEVGPDAMSCAVTVADADLGPGPWLGKLAYFSATRSGSASEVSMSVP